MPIFLGAIWASFQRFAMTRVGMWVVSAMIFLGISLASHEVLVGPIIDRIRGTGGLPADVMAWAGAFGVDKVLTMLLSAYATLAVKGGVKLVKRS